MICRLLGKGGLSVVFLGMAACLVWYGISTNRIAARDLEFCRKHLSTAIFPEVLMLNANMAYYVNLDVITAARQYRRVISREPTMIEAWLALAKAEQIMGHEDEARKIIRTVSPLVSPVSTWKWQEFLLAFEMRDEEQFALCLNFILARLPVRTSEACFLALSFWESWASILPHIEPEGRLAFLGQLMSARQSDVALSLWQVMEESDRPPDAELKLRFCQFLIDSGRLTPAIAVWKSWNKVELSGIYDGTFEREPLNKAFGWYLGRHPEVTIERSLEFPFEGSHCLNVHFRGTQNLSLSHVTQRVPVDPGKTYVLSFATKSRNLTTDQGVFVNVSGFRCSGLNVNSTPILGTNPWTREEIEVTVPEACEVIQIQVRRKESLKFDSKISGDYWLDAMELQPRM